MSGARSNLKPNTKILVSQSTEQAYADAAEIFLRSAERAIADHGVFTVALSGGSTPKKLFELMASAEWRERIPWNKIEFFWGDERYVPASDAASNFRMTMEAMLAKVPVMPERVHRVSTEIKPPDVAAELYEQEIKRTVATRSSATPEFDLILLGLGTNGHTASLFPHQPALHDVENLVIAEYIEEVEMTRITMTVPLLNAAKEVLFISLGKDKASVLKEVITGSYDPERLPAQLIQPDPGTLTWLIDPAAAQELPAEILTRK
jgi:6-phosphogluconolactonase